MNNKSELQDAVNTGADGLGISQSLTKEEIRGRLVTGDIKPERRCIEVFGVKLDIVQPPLKEVLRLQGADMDIAERSAMMVVKYACVPNTDERAFENADMEAILNWPWSKGVTELNEAVLELTGINISEAEEDLKKSPLDV